MTCPSAKRHGHSSSNMATKAVHSRLLFALLKLTLLIAAKTCRATCRLEFMRQAGRRGPRRYRGRDRRRVHSHEPRFQPNWMRQGGFRGVVHVRRCRSERWQTAATLPGAAQRPGAACLVAAAALLIWWQTDETASSGSNASAGLPLRWKRAEIADAKPEKVSRAFRGWMDPPRRHWCVPGQRHPECCRSARTRLPVQSSAPAGRNESKAASRAPRCTRSSRPWQPPGTG